MGQTPSRAIPQKAGLFIYGYHSDDTERSQRQVVGAYTEGRFGVQDKYFGLPKGSIDAGESPLIAAFREAAEETGFDMRNYLTPEQIAQAERGETLENITNPDFPGLVLRKLDPHPVDHTYRWHGYRPNHLLLFGAEFEGIERLTPYLKNAANHNDKSHVRRPVSDQVADPAKYPPLADLQTWLTTGTMPHREWNKHLSAEQWPQPFEKLESGQHFSVWFQELKSKLKLPDNPTLDQWQAFSDKVQRINGSTEKHFRSALKHIKAVMASPEMGLLQGDDGILKIDEKDRPFAYYQEGAELLPAEEYVFRCVERMRANKLYAQSFGGAAGAEYMRPRDYLDKSQLISCIPFIEPADIARAEQRLQRDIDSSWKRWDVNCGARPEKLGLAEAFTLKAEQVTPTGRPNWQKRENAREEQRANAVSGNALPALG